MGEDTKWKEMSPYEKDVRFDDIGRSLGMSRQDDEYRYSSGGNAYNAYMRNEAYEQDVKDTLANDYDTRRAIEAAAMAGDGKAEKLAKSDLTKGRNINKAYEFMGTPDDPADYGSKYYREVEAERNHFEDSIDERTDEKIDALKSDFMEKLKAQEKAATTIIKKEKPSDRLRQAREGVAEMEAEMYGSSTQTEAPDADEQSKSMAQEMLSNHKKRVVDKLTPARGRSVDGL